MSVGEFETTNLSWQLQQWQQKTQEWIELIISQLFPTESPNFSWPSLPSGNFDWLIYTVAILLSFAACWQLRGWILQFWHRTRSRNSATGQPLKQKQHFTVQDLLTRSRKYQAQGNYRAACHCLYVAMLQQLDESQIVPQQTSRTDGEYDRLLQQQPDYFAYKVLLETHQRLYFGKQQANADIFQRCQQAYKAIEQK